jgi:hypothetical protein
MALLATKNTPRPGAPANFGANVEGYDSPEETARIAAKIKRAGINLRYIAMDEPLWFGHYYNGGTPDGQDRLGKVSIPAFSKQHGIGRKCAR